MRAWHLFFGIACTASAVLFAVLEMYGFMVIALAVALVNARYFVSDD